MCDSASRNQEGQCCRQQSSNAQQEQRDPEQEQEVLWMMGDSSCQMSWCGLSEYFIGGVCDRVRVCQITIGFVCQDVVYNAMLHSLQPLSEEETERFTILYRIWVRIFFSDYVSEVKEVEPPKKTHIKGVYVSLVDLIAFKKAIKMDELRDRFYDVDAIIAELKAGYLLEQDAKEYKLNPYFLDSVMPVIDRILKELNEEREQKGQREGKDILICHNCKKIVESMYQELRLKKNYLLCLSQHRHPQAGG